MMRLVCLLRTGGDFEPRHVIRLVQQWSVHAPAHCAFMPVTDEPTISVQLRGLPLTSSWPGFFAKVELFKLRGPLLYMDLDVNVIRSLEPLVRAVAEHDFIVCRDFASPVEHIVNTSVMGWRGDVSALYRTFASDPQAMIERYGDPNRWQEPGRGWGDQGFVRDHWRGPLAFWQDLLPGAVVSFKADVLGSGIDPSKAAIVCSHGKPRPWEQGGADERFATAA